MKRPSKGRVRVAIGVALLSTSLLLAVACASGPSSSGAAPVKGAENENRARSYDALEIRLLRRMADGKETEVTRLERRLSELASVPIGVVVRHVEGGEGAPGTYEQRLEVGSERVALPKQVWSCGGAAECPAKEWLRFELRGAGPPRVIERVLYERAQGEKVPMPGYRRYTITVVSGKVARTDVERRIQEDHATLGLAERKKKADALKKSGDEPGAIAELDALDVGGTLGHELGLAFAAESDVLTERLAASFGVEIGRETPRILITTAESEGAHGRANLSLDLRLDEVRADAPDPAVARLFQLARGIEESALEAALLERLVSKQAGVSTARLMAEAHRRGIELRVITHGNQSEVAKLGAPPRFAALLTAAVEQGHHVVVPKSAVDLAGRRRWGFWQIAPETGVTVGVMEGGQHQGMVDYTQTVKTVALDEKKAFFIGMHAGMIQSEFMYAALMLKYGEVSPKLIQELKNALETSACSACPQAGIGVELSFKLGEDCYKKALFGLEKKLEFGFCDAYNNGFKCAVGMLVASLEGKNQLPAKIEPEASIKLGCKEAKVGGGDD